MRSPLVVDFDNAEVVVQEDIAFGHLREDPRGAGLGRRHGFRRFAPHARHRDVR